MPISKDDFRAALGRFVSGVTVVTARGDDDRPVGMTVSAFASVSLEPPLILACIDKRASVHGRFSEGSYFAVNILSEDQEHLSRRFASKDQDRFNGTRYTESVTGPRSLDAALSSKRSGVIHVYPGGSHTNLVAIVGRKIGVSRPPG